MPVERLKHIPGFNIDRVAAAAGDDPEVRRLENLDTDIPPPEEAMEATRAAIGKDEANSWLPFTGRDDLKEAVAAYIERRGGPRYDGRREIVITSGEGDAIVLEARRRIARHLRPTALFSYPTLNDVLRAEVFVKHENHQPIGAFKIRGGVNLISQLGRNERARGVIAASTGNHGQSVAYAARLFGVPATICVPENANPVKVASMRGLGAELVFHGRDFDAAREHCEHLADSALSSSDHHPSRTRPRPHRLCTYATTA